MTNERRFLNFMGVCVKLDQRVSISHYILRLMLGQYYTKALYTHKQLAISSNKPYAVGLGIFIPILRVRKMKLRGSAPKFFQFKLKNKVQRHSNVPELIQNCHCLGLCTISQQSC